MLLFNLLMDPIMLIVFWVVHAVAYFFILKKMSLKKRACIIPFWAEQQFTTLLFRRMRSFYRPFVVAVVLMLASLYLGTQEGLGFIYAITAIIVYGVFLIRLYWRMAKAFGKSKAFAIGLIVLPPLFLLILGFGRAQYTGIPLKPVKEHSRAGRFIRRTCLVLISTAEIAVLILGVGYFTLSALPPEILVDQQLSEIHDKTKSIQADDQFLSREDMMGKAAPAAAKLTPSRPHFFPDHSGDQSVVVMTYIIGSNLEHKGGLATANITQMKEATEKGSALTFVVEAGGSNRWFTDEIEYGSYGRYEIKDGKITKVKALPDDMSMSNEASLADFLKWTKKNYPADRYMLVLWDHGGGVSGGYGQDDLNDKTDSETTYGTMQVKEVLDAVKGADTKFDLIGFDACLMQDIEIAAAMEPYADYYLASEEVEGGYGWYYTSAFGKLAENPGLSTEKMIEDLLSTYDQLNTIVKDQDGKPDTGATLSLVDTTLAKPAYKKFCAFLARADEIIREDSGAYADFAVAGTNAYNFNGNIQIDLVDFLKVLRKADYDNTIASDEEIRELINTIRACVLYRNKNSASGINGIAFALPYKAIAEYTDTSAQLKAMSLKTERKVFNDIFSIMAAQKKKDMENGKKEDEASPFELLLSDETDYTAENWYVKGFENYEKAKALVDIPLKETKDGYEIQLPNKLWKIISDCKTIAYLDDSDDADSAGKRFLGSDYVGAEDADGHPMISMDDSWVHIGGQVVCYEADQIRETDEGDIYTGKVRARLNDKKDVVLYIEWDPVKDADEDPTSVQTGSDQNPVSASITGYDTETSERIGSFMEMKGLHKLKAGDTLQFIFDTYDEEGNLIRTAPEGKKVRVSKQERLKVEDAPLDDCDITFGGVLTDVYQRTMTTEMIDVHIGE